MKAIDLPAFRFRNLKNNLFFASLLFTIGLLSTSCNNDDADEPIVPFTLEENVQLSTQAEVNAFAELRVTQLSGNLVIGRTTGSSTDDEDPITDLSGLSLLTAIEGDLIISRTSELLELSGLEALNEISGDLIIRLNRELSTTFGLNNLQRIGGDLEISANSALNNLDALASVEGVQNFRFAHNAAMKRLFDMTSINSLNVVTIEGNTSLENIAGLNGTSIRELTINGNDVLENLRGLESTTNLASFELRYNESLKSVEGLENLRRISDALVIEYNDMLEDLNGMGFLESGPLTLNIANNPMLTSIDRFRMRNLSSADQGWAVIENNERLRGIEPLQGITALKTIWITNNPELTSLLPLADLESVNHLNVVANDGLQSLQGLENLREAGILYIGGNQGLTSLEGLSGLTGISNILQISGNENLNDLCAITSLIDGGGVQNELNISSNAFNPSMNDFAIGNCSN